jgi:hypothetical protein
MNDNGGVNDNSGVNVQGGRLTDKEKALPWIFRAKAIPPPERI